MSDLGKEMGEKQSSGPNDAPTDVLANVPTDKANTASETEEGPKELPDLNDIVSFFSSHQYGPQCPKSRPLPPFEPTPPFMSVLESIFHSNLNMDYIHSFQAILEWYIPQIIKTYGHGDTLLKYKVDDKECVANYVYEMSNVKITPSAPSIEECHEYGLHYTCDIEVECKLSSNIHEHPKIQRGLLVRLPFMTGYDPRSRYDIVGGFITRGKIRSAPHVKAPINDYPTLFRTKDGLVLQYRPTHRDRIFRATSTIELKIKAKNKRHSTLGFISTHLPYAKRDVHVVVFAVCLGCSAPDFIRLVRAAAGHHYQPDLFRSYEVSMLNNKYTSQLTNRDGAIMIISKLFGKKILSTGQLQIQNEFLPNLKDGNAPNSTLEQQRKLFLLAYLTAMIILSNEGKIPLPSRDDWSMSQLITSADHMGGLFRLWLYGHMRQVTQNLRSALNQNDTNHKPTLDDIDLVKILREKGSSDNLASAVANGVWSALRNGVTIALNSSNEDAITLQLRRISSALNHTEGSHQDSRGLTADQAGFICPVYSPDSESTGLVYDRAMTALITPPVPDFMVEVIEALLLHYLGKWMISLATYMKNPHPLQPEERYFMDIRGGILFVIRDGKAWIQEFLQLRRNGIFDRFIFISEHVGMQTISMFCKEGLLARPLIVATRMKDIGPHHTLEECLSQGIIEYVSPQEQSTLTKIAMLPEDVEEGVTTHVELFQGAFLGLTAGSIAFATNQQCARTTLICGQLKQNMTADIQRDRGSQSTAKLVYGFKDLVTTISRQLRPHSSVDRATPCVVLWHLSKSAQEDGVKIRKGFCELGGLLASTTISYISEAAQPNSTFAERFERPEEVIGKKTHNYSKIDADGMASCGTHLDATDIVIGKTATVLRTPCTSVGNNTKQLTVRRDVSTGIRPGHPGQVIKSRHKTLPMGTKVEIVVQTMRYMTMADKINTEQGMKGVAAEICPDVDMPFSETTGIIPDVIFSNHGPIGRVTPSMPISAMTGKAVSVSGELQFGVDMQDYSRSKAIHMEKVGDILVDAGLNRHGLEVIRNGQTGELTEGQMGMGVLMIHRLNHLCESKVHFRSTGSVDPKTRQPRDGRKNGSGAKNSDMELVAFFAHGVAHIAHKRFGEHSDAFPVYVCKSCQMLVDDVGVDIHFHWCRHCASETNVRKVKLNFTLLVLIYHLNALGFSVFLKTEDVNTGVMAPPTSCRQEEKTIQEPTSVEQLE